MLTLCCIIKLTNAKHMDGGDNMNRSLRIKGARTELGYTQDRMAELLGMSKPAYCNKENGKNEFTESEMIKMCKLLNKSLDYFFLEN